MAEDSAGGGAVRRVDEGWTRGCEEQIREVAEIPSGGSAGTSIAADLVYCLLLTIKSLL